MSGLGTFKDIWPGMRELEEAVDHRRTATAEVMQAEAAIKSSNEFADSMGYDRSEPMMEQGLAAVEHLEESELEMEQAIDLIYFRKAMSGVTKI